MSSDIVYQVCEGREFKPLWDQSFVSGASVKEALGIHFVGLGVVLDVVEERFGRWSRLRTTRRLASHLAWLVAVGLTGTFSFRSYPVGDSILPPEQTTALRWISSSGSVLSRSLRRYHLKKYTKPCARKTCSIVYSTTGISMYAIVRGSVCVHMAAISGIPRLCVFAAPQKQMATV
jgi:hypothetical protein